MTTSLPVELAAEVAAWPEFRMGVHRVRVTLRDGSTVEDVMVAGGIVRGVLARDETPFDAGDAIAVADWSEAPLPPGY